MWQGLLLLDAGLDVRLDLHGVAPFLVKEVLFDASAAFSNGAVVGIHSSKAHRRLPPDNTFGRFSRSRSEVPNASPDGTEVNLEQRTSQIFMVGPPVFSISRARNCREPLLSRNDGRPANLRRSPPPPRRNGTAVEKSPRRFSSS
jgi:hypothetical protein